MGQHVNRAIESLREAVLLEVSDQDDTKQTLAEAIKYARTEQKLSLQDVATRAGMSKAHIWDMERGRSVNPTVGALSSISAALGLPFRKLAASALLSHRSEQSK